MDSFHTEHKWSLAWKGVLGVMIFRGYPAKRAISAMRKHGG